MRRADRLFQIIQLLRRRRRAVTARWLAEELEVSERTVYRDIRDLVSNGTPIEGEAGVGYTLRRGYDLPPLMFDAEEIEALVLGARVVAAYGDNALAKAADRALSKVENVLPKRLKPKLAEARLFVPRLQKSREMGASLDTVRRAMGERRRLTFDYERADGENSSRTVRPLGAFFWGSSWTLTAWCELREDFRTFRLDRMASIVVREQTFPEEPGRTLRDYLRRLGPDAEHLLSG
ncbi:MAG: helix-turn-helix transcriptional regulator [Sandaracinaceae bacterium]